MTELIPDPPTELLASTAKCFSDTPVNTDYSNWTEEELDALRPLWEWAYRRGADDELQACCEWLHGGPFGFSIAAAASDLIGSLRVARRPKPPNLKQQALEALEELIHGASGVNVAPIRRALEALPDD